MVTLQDIRSCRVYQRGGKLYLDARTTYERVRISSGLSASDENRDYLMKDAYNRVLAHFNDQKEKSKITFDFISLGNALLGELCHLRESTLANYRYKLGILMDYFGRKDVRLLDNSDYKAFLENKPIKAYVKLINRTLKIANENGEEVKLLDIKRFAKVNVLEKDEVEPFSLDEIKDILAASDGEVKNYLATAFFTGMRIGEILALNVEDIDFDNKKIRINKTFTARFGVTPPKTKASNRHIDMLPIVAEALAKQCLHKSLSDRLFTESRVKIRNKFGEILKALELKERVLYNTRHSFASLMLSKGEEPLWVAAMLGHKNLNITYTFYAKYIQSNRPRATFIDFDLGGV